jgi:hypothetical protein
MDYLEFVAPVTSHIHDKGQVTVRYYGLYANAHRGKIRKASLTAFPLSMSEDELRHIPAFITDYAAVDRIIDCLKLAFVADRPRLLRSPSRRS